jgi:hypothetical protein
MELMYIELFMAKKIGSIFLKNWVMSYEKSKNLLCTEGRILAQVRKVSWVRKT